MIRRNFLFCACIFVANVGFPQYAEKWGEIPVIPDAYVHMIGKDGKLAVGEAVSAESSFGYDLSSGDIYFYEAASTGDGNCVSESGIVVGVDKVYMQGAFLLPDADPMVVEPLKKFPSGSVDAITWDGTRICGHVENPESVDFDEFNPDKQKMLYLPYYCDIEGDEISEVKILPTPGLDFFGLRPQYCTAKWISDDGKTIIGQVIANSGYYIYPIVYKEDDNGEWSYILPSESLFNPDGMEIPMWPVPEMEAPQAQDYIGDPELKAYFLELLAEWDGEEDSDPYQLLDPDGYSIMTQEEWEAWMNAFEEYKNYSENIYQPLVDQYYDLYSRFIAKSCNFLQTDMALNPQGTLMSQTRVITKFANDGNPVKYHVPYLFDLTDGSVKVLGEENSQLKITQILGDGTLIAATPKPGPASPDATPQHSYILLPENDEFMAMEEFIKSVNGNYAEWMNSYLFHSVPLGYNTNGEMIYADLTVTGLVVVSQDLSILAGGVDTEWWDIEDNAFYYAYFLNEVKNPDAGVESILGNKGEVFPQSVYNLQGRKIREIHKETELKELPKGVYIIGGKKVML